MFDEPFAQGDSFIHRLDPRVKVVAAIAAAVCLAALQRPEAAVAALVLSVLLLALSRPPCALALKRLAVVNIFILFMWLTVPATMGGETLWQLGPLTLSRRGTELMCLVTLKCNAIVISLLALLATMSSATLGAALERLHFPAKLTFLFLFVYRYIHVAAAEWRTLRNAARLRGFAPRTDMHSYRTIGCLLGMTFVCGFERAGRVYEAMLLRGFAGHFQTLASFRLGVADVVFAASVALGLASIIFYDFYPG